jgi:hypothetical protein
MEKEKTIMEKNANHQGKILSHGGKLALTDGHLIFKPHGLNVGAKTVIIPLTDIVDIGKTQTMFGASKEIWLNLKDGRLERFVLWGRDEFIDAVKKQIAIPKK